MRCPRRVCGGPKFESVHDHATRVHKYDFHVKLRRPAALPPVSAAAKPGRISFVDDHKIDGSRVECSTINSARSSSVEW